MSAQQCGKPLDSGRTAVVVVDYQNDMAHPKGVVCSGNDHSLMTRILEPQARILRAATAAGALVVFIRATVLPGSANLSPVTLRGRVKAFPKYRIPSLDIVVLGTWGHDVVEELKQAAPNAVHVLKDRNAGFVNTNLDLVLRSNGIDTLLFTGMATDGCVDATVRGAEDHGYRCMVIRDAVSSFKPELHEAALRLFAARVEVADSAEAVRLLDRSETSPSRRPPVVEQSGGTR